MKTYLYFLKNETNGLTKVGSSDNPHLRMNCVKYDANKEYLDHKFKPLYIAEISNREVEEKAHRLLKSKWVRREWFNLSERNIFALARILRLNLEKL